MLTQLEHLIDGKKSDQNLLNGFDPPLTIPKLLVISREAAQKLKFISNVCDSIKNLKGTAACSELYLISENEFGQFDQIAKSYFEKSLKPVWKISSNWLLNGQISDAFSEFYIRKNELGKFELREEMIPNFIPEKTIEQILQIGRTVNYIRTHTKGDVKIF
ncbi:Gamma-tubulin complex component 3, partial [Bonamia ostreae]